jgi:FdrA protein
MSDTTTMDTVLRARVLHHLYRDSVALLRIASTTERLDGIVRVGAVMATPANTAILAQSDMLPDTLDATADDLVFVVRGYNEQAVEAALDAAESALTVAETGAGQHAEQLPGTVPEGIAAAARDNGVAATLAAVSVPGTYASVVAEQSLRHGLHVLCFSDNVPIEDEVRLKTVAVERQLLMMGPDCGTAILDGVPLGFANVVRRGNIGIVAASGTGAQEVSRLIDAAGSGVSQLIGVGGRDLSADVGGLMTDLALGFLVEDPETSVIVVVSKPPAPEVADRLIKRLSRIAASGKPTIACFLGLDDSDPATPQTQVCIRGTLEGGAMAAASRDGHPFNVDDAVTANALELPGRILGLFTGGTLASEAKLIVQRGGAVAEVLDLGDDQYTAGKPHPMIDPDARAARIAAAGEDPSVGIILIDVVLGFGAAADPATPVADAVRSARHAAGADGRRLAVIGSVCGTDGDPQSLSHVRSILESAGVILCQTNAAAARLAVAMSQQHTTQQHGQHGMEAEA